MISTMIPKENKYSLRLGRFKSLANTIQTEIKYLVDPEQQHLHINIGQTNLAQKFRFGAYEEITLDVNTLQNCPGNSQSVFQFSSASEAKDCEAEINITDNGLRFFHIGLV